jgi:tetratricopeptide (TPR) repeat protein
VQPADDAPVAAIEVRKAAVAVIPAQPPRGPLPAFPFGPLFVIVLLLLCVFGDVISNVRVNTLGAVIDMVGLNTNPAIYVQNHVDRIRTASNGDRARMTREYEALANELKNKFGASDQLTYYVQLSLANDLIKSGNESDARKIWQDQIQYLDHPKANPPGRITEVLVDLAEYYTNIDKAAAREFYLAAVQFFPLAPTSGTVTNIEGNLADLDQSIGKFSEANEYYKRALALTLMHGNADFNLHRLRGVVRTDMALKQYADAIPYAAKAVPMAEALEGTGAAAIDKNTLHWLMNKVESMKSVPPATHGSD